MIETGIMLIPITQILLFLFIEFVPSLKFCYSFSYLCSNFDFFNGRQSLILGLSSAQIDPTRVTQISLKPRHGYAAVASMGVEPSSVKGGMSNVMFKKIGEESKETATATSWVPDPVTGYYRPEKASEIDIYPSPMGSGGKKVWGIRRLCMASDN